MTDAAVPSVARAHPASVAAFLEVTLPSVDALLGDAVSALVPGRPALPARLERTNGSPWRWASAIALRAAYPGMPPGRLAARLADIVPLGELVVAVTATPSGFVEVTVTERATRLALAGLAGLDGRAELAVLAGSDGRAGSAEAASAASSAARRTDPDTSRTMPSPRQSRWSRTLDDPLYSAQLAHARASRVLAASTTARVPPDSGSATLRTWWTTALLTELLDAGRRLRPDIPPRDRLAALAFVAGAFHPWFDRLGTPTPDGLLLAAATRGVLSRGLADLGHGAPERM